MDDVWIVYCYNSRMAVLGLIFQLVLASLLYKQIYTYNNDIITTLQKIHILNIKV